MSGQVVDEAYECVVCFQCRMKFWVPTFFHQTAMMLAEEFDFYCPAGHSQHFERQAADPPAGGGEVVTFTVFDGGKST